jgi:site-specific recombinase XerD
MRKSKEPIIKQIPDFLDYCELEKGLSEKTQENYKRYLRKFEQWLKKEKKTDLKPHELTTDDIWQYSLFLSRYRDNKDKKLKKRTQNYYLIALRALLSYFSTKGIQSIPFNQIILSKYAKEEESIKFLNLDQVNKLLSAPEINTKTGLRDKAILETLFSTGLRIAELVSLNKKQFNDTENKNDLELAITDKGKKSRTIYFSKRTIFWIKKYLESRTDDSKCLFVNYRKRKDADRRLTARSIERIVKKYSKIAGVPIFTTPNTLRHSHAINLLNKGVKIRKIKKFFGHKNIVTTKKYTNIYKIDNNDKKRRIKNLDKK